METINMTEQKVIAIATKVYNNELWGEAQRDKLMRFAKLVAEHEREACAKVADGWPDYDVQGLAEAIRARGQE